MTRTPVAAPSGTWHDFRAIVYTLGIVITLSLGLVISYKWGNSLAAVLWAIACLILGGLVGFLFGIPRVLQGTNPPPADGKNDVADYRQQVNTNLEQISDWLTKIIVGVGLVELRTFPDKLSAMSQFIASGIGGTQADQVFASALILFFAVIGFLGGYLITRIYLAGAFNRADLESQTSIYFAGESLSVAEVSADLSSQIDDLRSQVLKMTSQPTPRTTPEAKGGIGDIVPAPPVNLNQAILWVDDNPKENSVLIDQLSKRGFEVKTCLTTSEALKLFEAGRFGRVVSDMSRLEDGVLQQTAGLDVVKAIRQRNPTVPLVIYCVPELAERFRSDALAAGATAITASQTELYQALQIDL